MKWNFTTCEITLERRADVVRVIAWVVEAQQECVDVFNSIADDDSALRAELFELVGRPLKIFDLLRVVENHDVWFTGRNGTSDKGRRFFLGALVAAGVAPDGRPIGARTVAELLADDEHLDRRTATEVVRRRDDTALRTCATE